MGGPLWLKVRKAPVGAGPRQAREPAIPGEGSPLSCPVAARNALPSDVATVWGEAGGQSRTSAPCPGPCRAD